jgi:predicted PurR-regulated permease PerM
MPLEYSEYRPPGGKCVIVKPTMKQPRNSRALAIAVIIALAVGVLLLRNFFSLIVIAAIAAYLFTPVYEWLLVRTKRRETAATLTLLATFMVIIIPILLVLGVTLLQASTLVNDLTSFVENQDFGRIAQEILDWINLTVTNVTGRNPTLSYQDIATYLSGYIADFVNYVLDTIRSWIGGVGSIFTSIILYIYVFTGILMHGQKLTKIMQDLNPLGSQSTDLYINKAQAMTKAMVKGQFTIAVIQGATSALVLYLVGVPYVMFFLLILTFLSIIPLGAGIVTIPLGGLMMLFGNVFGGAIVILNHLIVVTNIDNVLKPKLVPKSVRLHPALLLLAVFGGMNLFGFLGIIIGPVLMILIVTTIQIYTDRNNRTKEQVA